MQNDSELVELSRKGDKEAFGRLVERYQPMAYRLAFQISNNRQIAYELVQEALLQAYLSLNQLRKTHLFRSWFYGITLNVCRSYRREQKLKFFSLEELAEQWPSAYSTQWFDPTPEPHEVSETRELQDILREAINSLSPQNRTVMLLFYYREWRLQEIAESLHLPLVTVKSRLYKARRQLEKRLLNSYPELEVEEAIPLPSLSISQRRSPVMLELKVAEVIKRSERSLLLLVDDSGQYVLSLLVEPHEADTVLEYLHKEALPDPPTLGLLTNLIKAGGLQLLEIRLEILKEPTLYGLLRLSKGKRLEEIETRPIEAILLALATQRPIMVTEEVISRAGINLAATASTTSATSPSVSSSSEADSFARAERAQTLTDLIAKLKENDWWVWQRFTRLNYSEQPLNLDFKAGLTGWKLGGSRSYDYTHEVTEEGEFWAKFNSLTNPAEGNVALYQNFLSDHYRGQRLRYSAYIKTQEVIDGVRLWMNIYGAPRILREDHMFDRLIRGTTEWQKYEVVLDVPQESLFINLGVLLNGSGQLWVKQLELAPVGEEVPQTGSDPYWPRNLDFREGTKGWFKQWVGEIPHDHYQFGIDPVVQHNQTPAAYLTQKLGDPSETGGILQSFDPEPYRGKRMAFSAYLKTEKVTRETYLLIRAFNGSTLVAYASNHGALLRGTQDWQKYEVMADIPAEADQLQIGLQLKGEGKVWIAEGAVCATEIETEPASTSPKFQPRNLNFASGLNGWHTFDYSQKKYEFGADQVGGFEQTPSAYLRWVNSTWQEPGGVLFQSFEAGPYRGKRVCYSAYLKTEQVKGLVFLSLRAFGEQTEVASANTKDKQPDATSEWQKQEIVLEIPQESTIIYFGICLEGQGQVRVSQVKFEVISG